MNTQIITVSALNEYVSTLFAADPILHSLRVQGEISGFKRHTSGHLYFSLKDENALVRCVMFRQNAMRLDFAPQDGMQVVLTGYASLYAKDGAFQLYAQSLQKQGAGALYARFLALKDRLEREGYFDAAHKKPLPFLPRRVGVVTSETGAAVQDVIHILTRRFPAMPIVLAPVKVQGPGAGEEIARAIDRMNRAAACDVMIVGRGGGSIEDLWAFNEPVVAKAIYESEIPIISAVGHETDFTIADFTADLRAPTPSAAAELAVPEYETVVDTVSAYGERLQRGLAGTLDRARSRVRLLAASASFYKMEARLAALRQNVDSHGESMTRSMGERLIAQRSRLQSAGDRLLAMNPGAVLQRGYAMIQRGDGETLSSIEQIEPEMQVRIVMNDGRADARILARRRNDG